MKKFSQKSIEGRVEKAIRENGLSLPGEKIAVALSGGADSVCLFDILLKLKERLGIEILAVHFNHRLRGEASDADEESVLKLCQKNNVECICGAAPEKNLYKSEEKARIARYAFFEKILEEGRAERIALAHQADDVAETVLQRIIRGTGLRGLSSIPSSRGQFIRPLLAVSRAEITAYLEANGLPFRNDESNSDLKFLRNQIRHQIIPELSKLNPNFNQVLLNLAETSSLESDYLEAEAARSFNAIKLQSEGGLSLDRNRFIRLHPALQRLVLRHALSQTDCLTDITLGQLTEAITLINKGTGQKYKRLPHSLRIELKGGKIVISKN